MDLCIFFIFSYAAFVLAHNCDLLSDFLQALAAHKKLTRLDRVRI